MNLHVSITELPQFPARGHCCFISFRYHRHPPDCRCMTLGKSRASQILLVNIKDKDLKTIQPPYHYSILRSCFSYFPCNETFLFVLSLPQSRFWSLHSWCIYHVSHFLIYPVNWQLDLEAQTTHFKLQALCMLGTLWVK